mgnify:FL=1
MKLSIIIPLYNSQDFIGNCLESLLRQDYNDIEIIVVNDGSTDNSKNIVERLAKENSNIRLLDKTNGGIGTARNLGVDKATGQYLYFIDSDDYIVENTLSLLMSIILNNNLEILGFATRNTKLLNQNTSSNKHMFHSESNISIHTGEEFIGKYNYRTEVWWYIIKKDFYDNSELRFHPRKFVQDSYFTPSLFLKAKRIGFIPIDVHRYVTNVNSITNTDSPEHIQKHMNDLLFAISQLHKLIKKAKTNECKNRLKNRQQSYVFFFFIRFAKSKMAFNELNQVIKEFKSYGAYPLTDFIGKDYNGIKYKILTYTFNSPPLRNLFLFVLRTTIRG